VNVRSHPSWQFVSFAGSQHGRLHKCSVSKHQRLGLASFPVQLLSYCKLVLWPRHPNLLEKGVLRVLPIITHAALPPSSLDRQFFFCAHRRSRLTPPQSCFSVAFERGTSRPPCELVTCPPLLSLTIRKYFFSFFSRLEPFPPTGSPLYLMASNTNKAVNSFFSSPPHFFCLPIRHRKQTFLAHFPPQPGLF